MKEEAVIEEFHKLEEEFGAQKAELLMNFMFRYMDRLTGHLATKEDMASLSADLNEKMARSSADLNEKMANLSADLNGKMGNVKLDMANLSADLSKNFNSTLLKIAAFLVAQTGLIIALIKFL